jgi:integrase
VRVRGGSLQVCVFAGVDPVTRRDRYLSETVKGTDRPARREAEKVMARLQTEVDGQRSAQSSVTLGYTLDEWLKTLEVEDSTRDGYIGYIERNIRPTLGAVPIAKLSTRMLETFYAELRRCRIRCNGRPSVGHRVVGNHACDAAGCTPHECKPLAASTVRQVHAVISGALSAAVRWDWIVANPARGAQRPRQTPPQPDPPSPADAARIVEGAFAVDDDWGTLVWLVMTTGMRRGEVCALRWSRVDLDLGVVDVRRSYRLRHGVGVEKDTKTHQMRRIALDTETVALLTEHKHRCAERMRLLGGELTENMYVFSNSRTFDPERPCSPHSVSSRYRNLARRLEIDTHIHALRHYSATELLTAGIDLRTVAGRLGHGGGGATTLRVYAAWVAATDRKAAEILGSRMPKRPTQRRVAGDGVDAQ